METDEKNIPLNLFCNILTFDDIWIICFKSLDLEVVSFFKLKFLH